MAKALRWGILSTGGIARTFTKDLAHVDEGVAVAVGSRSFDSANAFADEFDIPHRYGSYEELVGDPDVDAIYVGTPHPMHHDNAILALEHGKHVLVEKAFTVTAAEAREVVDVARRKGLFAMEAMWTRFLPSVVAIRELIARGELGEIVSVEADHGQWFDPDPSFRLFAPELGGGALLDLGVYPVSFASMILGSPNRIVALWDPAFTGVDAQTSMLFGYESGAQAILTCTLRARSATRACVTGEQARIEIDGSFYSATAFSLIDRDGAIRRFDFPREGRGLLYETQEVARCVEAGLLESPIMPLDETISIMETMDSVRATTQNTP
jgi:predicted dehydrogenase